MYYYNETLLIFIYNLCINLLSIDVEEVYIYINTYNLISIPLSLGLGLIKRKKDFELIQPVSEGSIELYTSQVLKRLCFLDLTCRVYYTYYNDEVQIDFNKLTPELQEYLLANCSYETIKTFIFT
jgi:hypothetical protein